MKRIFNTLLLALCILCQGVIAIAQSAPVASSGAEAYHQWVLSCIDEVDRNVPAMRASAEIAARRYINSRELLCTRGDSSLAVEITFRSGGLYNLTQNIKEDNIGLDKVGVVLYAVRPSMLNMDAACIRELQRRGIVVVTFGEPTALERLRKLRIPTDGLVEVPAAPQNGLFPGKDGRWRIPTRQVANGITVWAWVGEFVVACTREGKMPVMYKGDAVKGKVRMAKYSDMKLHPDITPVPVPSGQCGHDYLKALRATMETIGREEMTDIKAAADLAVAARRNGHNVYAFLHGHGMLFETLTGPYDTGVFMKINNSWFDQKKDITLKAGDVVFCDGFDSVFQGKRWFNFAENARAAGATLIWCITDYRSGDADQETVNATIDPECSQGDAYTIPTNEIFIDQHWALGDAVVDVPGYDIKILPTSGVIGQSILWMLQAETADRLGLLAGH